MKTPLHIAIAACFLFKVSADNGPNESTLTLVNDVSFNQMSVTISVPIFGSDTKTSVLTGDLQATTDIDPITAFSNELTFGAGSRANASPVDFSLGSVITGYVSISASNLSASLTTPFAPGAVASPTGIFDASEHDFVIDQGTISATIPGSSSPTNINLAETTITGTGSGNGTITVAEDGRTSTRITYTITVTMPFTASQQVPFDNPLGGDPINATVTVNGTMKATSTVFVYISAYLQWTEENSASGAGFDSYDLGTIPNGILWSLGYSSINQPNRLIIPESGNLTIALPSGGTIHPFVIECSPDLSNWDPVADSKVSTGSSTIPIGSTETINITPSGAFNFYRIKASQ